MQIDFFFCKPKSRYKKNVTNRKLDQTIQGSMSRNWRPKFFNHKPFKKRKWPSRIPENCTKWLQLFWRLKNYTVVSKVTATRKILGVKIRKFYQLPIGGTVGIYIYIYIDFSDWPSAFTLLFFIGIYFVA